MLWTTQQFSKILQGAGEDEPEQTRLGFVNNPMMGWYLNEADREAHILQGYKVPIRLDPNFAAQRAQDASIKQTVDQNTKTGDANRVFRETTDALIVQMATLKGNTYYDRYVGGSRIDALADAVTNYETGDEQAINFLKMIGDKLSDTELRNTMNTYFRDRPQLVPKFITFLRDPVNPPAVRNKGNNLWSLYSSNIWKMSS